MRLRYRLPRAMTRQGIAEEHLVHWNEITHDQLAAFKTTLDVAPNEAAMQTFLEENPQVLVQPIGGGYDRWVVPKARLGAEHETDFLVAERDAARYVWYAVELERPQARLFTAKGDPSAALTHAIRQVNDWRTWLSYNRDYATRAPEQVGLGLTDIDPELEGLIIMGREADIDPRTADRRARLTREHRIKIYTYDWLGERAREHLSAFDARANEDPLVAFMTNIPSYPKRPSERALEMVFGATSSATMDVSATRTVDWNSVSIETAQGDEFDVVADFATTYGYHFARADWDDWLQHVHEEIRENFSLLLTELKPDRDLTDLLEVESEGVWFQASEPKLLQASRFDVLVYLEQADSVEDCINRLSAAHQALLRYLPDARPSFAAEIQARIAAKDKDEGT